MLVLWEKRNCPRVCESLPDNYRDDLQTKPRIHAGFQRFWGRIMGMDAEQPDELWRRYGDFYLYLTQKVDAEIARVLDALDASGTAADTLTVFLADHGEMAGAHKLQGKGPFAYHENVQVPLTFRWPGRFLPEWRPPRWPTTSTRNEMAARLRTAEENEMKPIDPNAVAKDQRSDSGRKNTR